MSFFTPTDSLTINMGAGNDSLTINYFEEGLGTSLIVDGEAGDDTITVPAGVTVSTREIAGTDHLNDLSSGPSGSLSFSAETIDVDAGASLLAHGASSGNVDLTAFATSTATADLATSIDVDGAVIETLWKGDLPETAE